jgi:hypothetical protein
MDLEQWVAEAVHDPARIPMSVAEIGQHVFFQHGYRATEEQLIYVLDWLEDDVFITEGWVVTPSQRPIPHKGEGAMWTKWERGPVVYPKRPAWKDREEGVLVAP